MTATWCSGAFLRSLFGLTRVIACVESVQGGRCFGELQRVKTSHKNKAKAKASLVDEGVCFRLVNGEHVDLNHRS